MNKFFFRVRRRMGKMGVSHIKKLFIYGIFVRLIPNFQTSMNVLVEMVVVVRNVLTHPVHLNVNVTNFSGTTCPTQNLGKVEKKNLAKA